MRFNKYDDFINEDKISRKKKKLANLQKDLEKAKSKKDTKKQAKIEKEIEHLNELIGALIHTQKKVKGKEKANNKPENTVTNNTEEKKEENAEEKKEDAENTATNNTEEKKEENAEEKKEGSNGEAGGEVDVKKMSKDELNAKLKEWNEKYSQEFKFKNDMPKTPASNSAELMNSLSDERKSAVQEGIDILVRFFSSPHFKGQTIEISGYTSSTGSDSYNLSLSDRRAESVMNSVETLLKEKKVDNDITFTTVGHGEDTNYLIILNDTTTDPPKVNTKIAKISKEVIAKITDSKEAKQELNRRVVIKLKGFPNEEVIGTVEPVEPTEEVKTVEKPETPNPQNVEFNYDSYILTKESEQLLKNFASDVKKYNSSKEGDEKIKTLYISAHTKKPNEENKKNETRQKKLLAHLSTNRAYTVKRYLQIEIGEEISKDITFFSYPVSFNMGKEKKVEIHFDNSKHMQEAKKTFSNMANEYDIKEGKRGYGGGNYTTNDALRENIIYNIEGYSKAGTSSKKIPLELWYSSGRFGLGHEEGLDKFKDELKKIAKKSKYEMNIEDYIYKSI
jgi:outer membrane protein OmpA-like peptidoglycan-associated protein